MVTNRRYKSIEGLYDPKREPKTDDGKTYREAFWDSVAAESKEAVAKRTAKNAKTAHLKPYPEWCCTECASEAGIKGRASISTWHKGLCGVCGELKTVTEPRDFGYPDFKGHSN